MASGNPDAVRVAIQAVWQRRSLVPDFGWCSLMADAHLASGDLAAARLDADRAIASVAGLGQKYQLMLALLASARVAAAAGAVELAHDDALRGLTLGRAIESTSGIIDALECLGGLARGADDQQKAVRLLGAAEALRQDTGYQRFRLYQPAYDATVTELRAGLGEEAFDRACNEGSALSLDDAVNYALRGRGERKRPPIGWLSLTPAEREVARLVAEGLQNKEIAAKLFISARTVQTHLTHMYGKLGVTSRVQLAQQAARHAETLAPPD
jgi:DNA-binding CsgD family transcriptional regulator